MNFDLSFYFQLFLRRLPAMLTIIVICSIIGAVIAMRAPTTYSAEARLLVEDPQIPGELAASTVQTDPSAAIEIIRQRLLTRANMLDIANDFDVFENYSALTPDEIVDRMRASTNIRSRGGGRSGEPVVVTVAFSARTGGIAADVVNEYVTRIVNANVELRTDRAEGTLQFFRQEVQRLSDELDTQSARITQFQAQNSDSLPGEQEFRMSRLSLLQERIANAERERAALADQRARIVEVFERTGEVAGAVPQTPEQEELARLERELSDALLIYSEENPQVQLLRRRIDRLRDNVQAALADAAEEGDETSGAPALLEIQLVQLDSRIEALDNIIAEAREEAAELEEAIARTPETAITLRALERDYENIRRQYDSVVARLAEASTGERIEVTARGQRISVIEAATVPNQPSSPNRTRIAAMGVAAGIGLAGGLFALLELLNRSVRRPAEITGSLGITPLATIPFIESPRDRLVRRLLQGAFVLIILVGIPAGLWAVDTYYQPLDQLAERIIRSIGLS
jgi:polysaccharide chain length determinant protein (PEP-CTERM system associated)